MEAAAVPDFLVEDLLDFPTGDDAGEMFIIDSADHLNSTTGSSTPVHSSNSSLSDNNDNTTHFSSSATAELCVPYDDLAELEWLSNFVEESFSTGELHKFQPFSESPNGPTRLKPEPIFKPDTMVPGKARSKLSRVAPSNWSTRVQMVTGPTNSAHLVIPKKPVGRRREGPNSREGEVRRCLHCASEKTPQWRTGPMGPKTLCNACGVRYKSGRLVPEYRPASSPTFLATKHSNSHRKVMELRRQKEKHIQRHQQQQFIGQDGGAMFGISGGDEYLVCRHVGAM
ncbi:GATA transcription factor 9-like protein [Drosera capensis]